MEQLWMYLNPRRKMKWSIIEFEHDKMNTLNYYEIKDRPRPASCYNQCRTALVDKKGVLSKSALCPKEAWCDDVSDISHPLHILGSSIIESSKQAIQAINDDNEIYMKMIQNRLKQCGIIYLLYGAVVNLEDNELDDETLELLEQQDRWK